MVWLKNALINLIKIFLQTKILLSIRYNEMVTLELELAELRKQRNAEWEKTKHHLKLAKSKNSFEENGEAEDVNNSRDSFV